MNYETIIQDTLKFVEAHHSTDFSGHDFEHVKRVWINSKKILQSEVNANSLIVEIAALLHDVDDWKIVKDAKPTHFAEDYMERISLDSSLREIVNNIITSIGFKGHVNLKRLETIEERIVFDADKIDAIGAIGISRTFAFGGSKNRPIFNPNIFPLDFINPEIYKDMGRPENNSINHFFDKLLLIKDLMQTETGKREAQKRHDFMITFLSNFFDEQDCNNWSNYLRKFLSKQTKL